MHGRRSSTFIMSYWAFRSCVSVQLLTFSAWSSQKANLRLVVAQMLFSSIPKPACRNQGIVLLARFASLARVPAMSQQKRVPGRACWPVYDYGPLSQGSAS